MEDTFQSARDPGNAVFRAAGRSVDDVIDRRLLHCPFPGIPIVSGQGEAMPILVVQLHVVTAIIIAGPTRFLAEQGVMGHAIEAKSRWWSSQAR